MNLILLVFEFRKKSYKTEISVYLSKSEITMDDLIYLAAVDLLNEDDLEEAIFLNLLQDEPHVAGAERPLQFQYQNWNERDYLTSTRFEKEDIPHLRQLLNIPDVVKSGERHSVTGDLGLCILLRRLAYPNRLVELQSVFGLSTPSLSQISNTVLDIIYQQKGHLLQDLRNLNWLTEERLKRFAEVIGQRSPLNNCWGFIDGTARPICRPSVNQQAYYSGHKRTHCLKYQNVVCPDGIIASMMGPFQGSRHDAGMLRESRLYEQLEAKAKFSDDSKFVIYGDPAYPIMELILKPFSTRNITPIEANFNRRMSTVRQAVEWSFGKIIAEFAFLDFKKNQKLLWQDVGKMYVVGTLLTNCHTCLYGSQSSIYFNLEPVTLEQYLQ